MAKAGLTNMGGSGKSGRVVTRATRDDCERCFATHVGTRFYASLSRLNQLAAAVSDWTAPRGLRVPDQRPFFAFHSARELAGDLHLPWFSTSTPFGFKQLAGSLARWLPSPFVRPSLVCCRRCCAACKRQTPSAGPGPGSRPDPPPTASFSVSHCSVAKRASASVTLGPLVINPAPFCQPPPPSSRPGAPAPSSQPARAPRLAVRNKPSRVHGLSRPRAHRTRHSDL